MRKIVIITLVSILTLSSSTLIGYAKDKKQEHNKDNNVNYFIDGDSKVQDSEMNDNLPVGDRTDDILNDHDPVNNDASADLLNGGMPSITPSTEF